MAKKKTKKKAKKTTGKTNDPQIRGFLLNDLSPAKYNPRKIEPAAFRALEKSVKQFGLVEPIIVNIRGGKNVIVGGHQRFKVLKKQKKKNAICIVVDLSVAKEKVLNLALNNPASQGEFILDLESHIADVEKTLGDDSLLIDLRIKELQGGLITPDFDMLDEPEISTKPAEVQIAIGEYRFKVTRKKYDTWKNGIRREKGFKEDQIIKAIRKKLSL